MQNLVNQMPSLTTAREALKRAGVLFRDSSAERRLRHRRLRAANDPHLRDLSDHLLRDIGFVREPGVRADRMDPFI
jgi:uncharacterized protein YjiS (DUF1127 family)